MALLLARLAGRVSPNSINMLVWADADVDVTVTLSDGQTDIQTSNSATENGTLVFEFFGLTADTTYTVTVSAQGLTETLYPRTAPESGSTFSIAAAPCLQNDKYFVQGLDMIRKYDPRIYFGNGDWPYTNLAMSRSGLNLVGWNTKGTTMTVSDVQEFHNLVMRDALYAKAMSKMHWIHSMDDHEVPGSNWDNSLIQCTDDGAGGTITNPYDDIGGANPFTDALDIARQATWSYNNRAQFTGSNGATPSAYTDVHYHAFDMGDARIIVLDCITYKTPGKSSAYPASTCLGVTQHEWLLNELKTTDKTWKIIVSDKQIISDRGSGDGLDSYDHASGEKEIILDFIDAGTDWAIYGGCVWLTGDRHNFSVIQDRVLQLTASLGGTHTNGDLTTGSRQHVWGYDYATNFDPSGAGDRFYKKVGGYAVARVVGNEKLQLFIETNKGTWWQGELLAGSNAVSYANQTMSIG